MSTEGSSFDDNDEYSISGEHSEIDNLNDGHSIIEGEDDYTDDEDFVQFIERYG